MGVFCLSRFNQPYLDYLLTTLTKNTTPRTAPWAPKPPNICIVSQRQRRTTTSFSLAIYFLKTSGSKIFPLLIIIAISREWDCFHHTHSINTSPPPSTYRHRSPPPSPPPRHFTRLCFASNLTKPHIKYTGGTIFKFKLLLLLLLLLNSQYLIN